MTKSEGDTEEKKKKKSPFCHQCEVFYWVKMPKDYSCPYFLQLIHSCSLLSPPPSIQLQCGQWLPVLMVVIATALAVFLANKGNLVI